MTRSVRGFWTLLAGCGAIAAAGVGVAAWGIRTPIFTVPAEEAMRARALWCDEQATIDHAAGDRYLALFSNHYVLKDIGVGLVLAALAVAALGTLLKTTARPGQPWLRTPRNRLAFVGIGLAVLLIGQMGTNASYGTELYRGYFPSCADTIAIPVGQLTMLATLLAIPLTATGGLLTLGFGGLPVSLTRWDRDRPVRSWIVTIVFGALMAFIAFVGVDALRSATNLWEPSLVVAFYLLASTRAAMLAPKEAPEAALVFAEV